MFFLAFLVEAVAPDGKVASAPRAATRSHGNSRLVINLEDNPRDGDTEILKQMPKTFSDAPAEGCGVQLGFGG